MQGIGLSELIEKVKTDLLTPPKGKNKPFLFVDSVELELQVVVKKDANTGIEVDVIGIGGASLGADVGQENIQTIKVNLSPLFTKEEIREYYEAFRPNDVLPMINTAMQGVVKQGTEAAAGEGF
ncbi:MAG TPA: trypco2 family protein [Allocoleopsis sp.]